MTMKGLVRNFPPLELLSTQQMESLHSATLEVLQETGVVFDHERALRLFADHGCRVDFDKKLVKIPDYLVEQSLRHCPSSFHVRARDPKNDLRIGANTTYFLTFCGLKTLDLDTWEPRTATLQDLNDAVRILDALEYIHMQDYGPYFELEGVPPAMVMPTAFAGQLRNSSKITYSGFKQDFELFAIEMAKVAGTEVLGSIMDAAPLMYQHEALEATFRFIEAGWPMKVNSSGVFGGTHPATLAGSLITIDATELAAIVLIQLVKPGTGVTVLHFSFPMDMRTGQLAFGGIESYLQQVAFNQVWRRYGVPTFNNTIISSSKLIDYQCGYEKAVGTVLAVLSGGNVVQGAGGVYGEVTYHPAMTVIDDDLYGMVARFVRGMEITDQTMAIDLIREIGPLPGSYLGTAHTRAEWRKESFIPKVADRLSYPDWLQKGKKTALTNARDRAAHILATHQPTPLSEVQEREIERILASARKHYSNKGLM
jgi:trimethylamine--corrinoid protein Co-methyltransferase